LIYLVEGEQFKDLLRSKRQFRDLSRSWSRRRTSLT